MAYHNATNFKLYSVYISEAGEAWTDPLKFCVMILYRLGGLSGSGWNDISLRYQISSMEDWRFSLLCAAWSGVAWGSCVVAMDSPFAVEGSVIARTET